MRRLRRLAVQFAGLEHQACSRISELETGFLKAKLSPEKKEEK